MESGRNESRSVTGNGSIEPVIKVKGDEHVRPKDG